MRHRKDNKRKWGVIITTAIIVFSMIFSIFAIVIDNQSQSIPQYNKHSFTLTEYGYRTKVADKYLDFYYYPTDIERITIDATIVNTLKNSEGIAVVFNPNDNITANLEYIDLIRYELPLQLDKTIYFGITEQSSRYGLQILGCENSTEMYPLILINISSNTSFVKSQEYPGCFIMNAKLKDLIAARDRMIYSYYGIMS